MSQSSSSSSGLQLPENSRIVSASYLEKKSSKKDLIRRLRNVIKVLQTDNVEVESDEWPGLANLSNHLIQYFQNPQKEIRLYSLLCGMELLSLWAPEVPWDINDLKGFFQCMISQLGNLANVTDGSQFTNYMYILTCLCETRMANLLVDLFNDGDDESLELLVDLVHTLLNSLRHDHSAELNELVRAIVCGTLEEFCSNSVRVPIRILDELLTSLVHGPKVHILADHAGPSRSKKGLPKVLVTNNTYVAAASILRQLLNKLAQPVSDLLNGLLNSQTFYMEQSNIHCDGSHSEIYQIVFELHRVAPQILITVLGTVCHGLETSDHSVRLATTALLGKLFAHGDWADQYSAAFRQWMARKKDKSTDIRLCIVEHCLQLCASQDSAIDTLVHLCTNDQDLQVRQTCIRGICSLAYGRAVPTRLLRAVGNRVTSRQKDERLDAITGLSHVYAKQYLVQNLRQSSGETTTLLNSLHGLLMHRRDEEDEDDDLYTWIPAKVLEAITIPDMRHRVFSILDESFVSAKLDPSERAAAWTVIFHHLQDSEYFLSLLKQRSTFQNLLGAYLGARSKRSGFNRASEEYHSADAVCLEKLENIAKMVGNETILELHKVRDKHVFRILGMLATSAHSMQARKRAIEELPKHTSGALSKYIGDFAKICAMGDSLNRDTVEQCAQLANEAFEEGDYDVLNSVLSTIHTMVEIFPPVGQQALKSLIELFSECRMAASNVKKNLRTTVTVLSSILSKVPQPKKEELDFNLSDLQAQLEDLCTKDGSPEQAQNAVYALRRLHGSQNLQRFSSLLDTLTSASKLRVSADKKESVKVVTYLASLAALAECAPALLSSSPRTTRAIQFALEKILLGRDGDSSDSDSDDDADVEDETPAKRRSRKKHGTPKSNGPILEDSNLSVSCRRLCAAMDFLVSFVRSSSLAHQSNKDDKTVRILPKEQVRTFLQLLSMIIQDHGLPPSRADRKLCQSRQDRAALRQNAGVSLVRLCDPRLGFERDLDLVTNSMWHTLGDVIVDEERVVRDAIVKEMSQLFTGRGLYGLDKTQHKAKPPSLRLLALLALCSDRDHETNSILTNTGKSASSFQKAAEKCVVTLRSTSHQIYTLCCADGKAAEERFENIYKLQLMPEYAVPYALHLLAHRRETPSEQDSDEIGDNEECDDCALSSENQHSLLRKRLKFLFQPLVESLGDQADNISFLLQMTDVLGQLYIPIDASPMVMNAASPQSRSSLGSPELTNKNREPNFARKRSQLLRRKLELVCQEARNVLLAGFVKKDANLSPYPGQMRVPAHLFKQVEGKRGSSDSMTPIGTKKRAASPAKKRHAKKIAHTPPPSVLKRRSGRHSDGASLSASPKVHFSPDTKVRAGSKSPKAASSPTESLKLSSDSIADEDSFQASPAAKSPRSVKTPVSAAKSSGSEKSVATMGSSPPSMLQTMRSTAPNEDSDDDLDLLSTQDNDTVQSVKSLRLAKLSQSSGEVPSSKSTTQSSTETTPPKKGRLSLGSTSTRSTKSSGKKRRFGGDLSKKRPSKKSRPPTSIAVKKSQKTPSKKKKKSKKAVDEFEFDSGDDADMENAPTVNKKAKTKASSTKKSTSRQTTRSTRSRRGVA